MRIFVIGTRGIPDIPGGVERHCQELFPRIARRASEVLVCTRRPYIQEKIAEWKGVRLLDCYAPRRKSLEAIVHTFLALLKARRYSPDVVHIHGIGPALLAPFARLMGLQVVFTNHGPDYDREKWGRFAKFVLRFGERLGGAFADEIIVISSVIADIMRTKCRRDSNLIYNGVNLPVRSVASDFLSKKGIVPDRYVLAVARLVPEKGLHDLMEAFKGLQGDHQLVIAGDADYETEYSRTLRRIAAGDDRIILTGYLTGTALNQVYSHAALFVLPSYHEGLPIALLEALSFGLPVLVSDIPANKEVGLPKEGYFRCGDADDLRNRIEEALKRGLPERVRRIIREQIKERYDWDTIADETFQVYEMALTKRIGKRKTVEEPLKHLQDRTRFSPIRLRG